MQLPDFTKANILVVGDLMLDRYWTGPTERVSPEAPVPVVKINGIEERPGGAANVALNAAALGANVTLVGMCGQDHAAKVLSECLLSLGVTCDFVEVAEFDTITKLRVLSRHQQLIRLDFEKNFSEVEKTGLQEKFAKHLHTADLVVLSDYDKGCLSHVAELIKVAREQNIPVVVDPKGGDFTKYRGATLITPNMQEFETVCGQCENEDMLVEKAQALSEALELHGLLVTRSEKGMTLLQKGEAEMHMPAKAKEVYDVTGAGDTVISTLAASFAAGAGWQDACALANAAASIVVGKLGTSTVSVSELSEAMRRDNMPGNGVMTAQQLIMVTSAAKKQGNRIVMTNGCFDILHAGHVSYLENAARLGDKLIVAVNDDASVRKLKGQGRPINNLERRMAVLAGLASVDWVVPFSEDTPEQLIAAVLPDVLVKGGDYQIEQIAGGKQVIANGGEVRVLNFEDGVSTTRIIENIKGQP